MFRNYNLKIIIFFKKKFIGFKQINEKVIKERKNQDYQNKDLIKLILLKNKEFRKNKDKLILEDKKFFNKIFKKKKTNKSFRFRWGRWS